jgi:hypothetical protein
MIVICCELIVCMYVNVYSLKNIYKFCAFFMSKCSHPATARIFEVMSASFQVLELYIRFNTYKNSVFIFVNVRIISRHCRAMIVLTLFMG